MRGSPLIRTVLVLLALVVSGIGFARLTGSDAAPLPEPVVVGDLPGIQARIRLDFSAIPGEVTLESSGKTVALSRESAASFSGVALIAPKAPVLFLTATRAGRSEGEAPPFFAKLVVEADGKETFTHVFDSPGDIDDFVELPF